MKLDGGRVDAQRRPGYNRYRPGYRHHRALCRRKSWSRKGPIVAYFVPCQGRIVTIGLHLLIRASVARRAREPLLLSCKAVTALPGIEGDRDVAASRYFLEQGFRLAQVQRVKTFSEPFEYRSQQFRRTRPSMLDLPELCETHGCAQFPGFRLVVAGNLK